MMHTGIFIIISLPGPPNAFVHTALPSSCPMNCLATYLSAFGGEPRGWAGGHHVEPFLEQGLRPLVLPVNPVDLLGFVQIPPRPSHSITPQRSSSRALPILCDHDRVQPAERARCVPIPQGDLLWCHLNPEVHPSTGNAQFAKVSPSGLGVCAACLLTNDLPVNCEACQMGGAARDQQDLSPDWSSRLTASPSARPPEG